MARDGAVGEATYEAVTALEAQGKTRQEAFNQVAEDRGQQAGTVAANYYRVARKKSGKPRRAQRSPQRVALASHVPTPPARNGSAEALYRCIEQMVDEAVEKRVQRMLA